MIKKIMCVVAVATLSGGMLSGCQSTMQSSTAETRLHFIDTQHSSMLVDQKAAKSQQLRQPKMGDTWCDWLSCR